MIFKNGAKNTPWKKGSLFNNQPNGKAPTEQEKTLGSLLSEKELISNIYMTYQNFIIKKKERTQLKKGKRLKKKKFIQRRHTNDQQTFEKMLNSTNHQGNTNQKDSGILPNTR